MAASSSAETAIRVATALRGVQAFNSSHAFGDLQTAIGTLLAAPRADWSDTRQNISSRRMVLRAWARIFATIDRSYDPAFDPTNPLDLPLSCLTPPREANGMQLPACADPRDVRDPKARATYAAALRENERKARQAYFQIHLRLLDNDAMQCVEQNLRFFRSAAPADSSALAAILREAGLTAERRKTIEAMF